jgi:hypothetical protein
MMISEFSVGSVPPVPRDADGLVCVVDKSGHAFHSTPAVQSLQ